jgi:hypothetical protein
MQQQKRASRRRSDKSSPKFFKAVEAKVGSFSKRFCRATKHFPRSFRRVDLRTTVYVLAE